VGRAELCLAVQAGGGRGGPGGNADGVLNSRPPLDRTALARLVLAAGYDPATPLALGVSSPAGTVVLGQGAAASGEVDGDALAYACSLAKQITGACAALLSQGGELELDAPITAWLSELPRWADTVRVRHLIHHTAGLPSTDAIWAAMRNAGERDWTSDGAIAALSTFDAPVGRAGAAYGYSNVGYICLARIVEHASLSDLDAFAHKRLFEPLRMRATRLWRGPAPAPPNATWLQPASPPAPLSLGDGGLWTTVRDLLRWNEALFDDRLGISGTLHTTGTLDDGTPLDYAWGVRVLRLRGGCLHSHGGSWEAASAKLVRLPDLRTGFAALAADASVERMTALASLLQAELLDVAL
jgi:CubicO group peptidase (beta-lactamase class C family)